MDSPPLAWHGGFCSTCGDLVDYTPFLSGLVGGEAWDEERCEVCSLFFLFVSSILPFFFADRMAGFRSEREGASALALGVRL